MFELEVSSLLLGEQKWLVPFYIQEGKPQMCSVVEIVILGARIQSHLDIGFLNKKRHGGNTKTGFR
jgi:hypothetical protein